MTKKPKIAIVLEFGFHEIKKYIHSGFTTELAKEFNIVWIALDKGSKEFDAYFRATGFPLFYIAKSEFYRPVLNIEKYNIALRKNWLVNKKLGAFHNHSKVKDRNLKTFIFGNSFLKNLLEKFTLSKIKGHYYSSYVANVFKTNSIDILFTTGYASCFSKSLVITAMQIGIPVHYLVNSWKDLYINNFIPFEGLSKIYVWSEAMKIDYLKHMPYLKREAFVISGNPTFDVLLDYTPSKERSYYAEKYQLPISAKWLLYTMMPVGIASDEIETIIFIAKEILKSFSKEEMSIIIRRNPTHNNEDFESLNLPENLVLAEHYCSFDKTNDMIIQSETGEKEWNDLLQYCSMNLSVPSTVTLEFLMLNKSIANIEFNKNNIIDERLKQFFEAGFYQSMFDNDLVFRCSNFNDLLQVLTVNNSFKFKDNLIPKRASKILIDSIKNT